MYSCLFALLGRALRLPTAPHGWDPAEAAERLELGLEEEALVGHHVEAFDHQLEEAADKN